MIHVVWRICHGLPKLRTPKILRRIERVIRKSNQQDGFLLVEYSILDDHLHLIVEVKDRRKLSRALQALGIRIAKTLNAHWHRKKGHVFAERYFAVALREMRRISVPLTEPAPDERSLRWLYPPATPLRLTPPAPTAPLLRPQRACARRAGANATARRGRGGRRAVRRERGAT